MLPGPRSARSIRAASQTLERLEPRTLLSDTPFPDLSSLAHASDTVIRFETTFGDVDIELFDAGAPNTVRNFLAYVTSGRLDLTFFHRNVDANTSGIGVVQGGGFLFNNSTGVSEVQHDAPVNLETTGGSNVERTIAMARTNDPNSATSQFFFNTVDNSEQLDPNFQSQGYAVFGRVVQGWQVILDIYARPATDISSVPPIAGTPLAGTFTETPVTSTYSPTQGVRESSLLFITNAEIIKPTGSTGFYAQRVVFPEGQRTDAANESITLSNPNAASATYQIIARYESGFRELVIQTGVLNPGATLTIPVSAAGQATPNLVRRDAPYSLIIEASLPTDVTNPLPIIASSTRSDFGATASESFLNVHAFTDDQLKTWDFARIEANALSEPFLLWQNLTHDTATVTVTFFVAGGTPTAFSFALAPYRRGGVEVFSLGLPDGAYAARVQSDQPIVAALSDWDLPADPAATDPSYTPGWTTLGVNGGLTDSTTNSGIFADAEMLAGYSNLVSIVNPGTTAAIVTLSFWTSARLVGDAPITRIVFLSPQSRQDYALDPALVGVPYGERFTISYSSGSAPVGLQYTSVDESGRFLASASAFTDRGTSTSFTNATAASLGFAGAVLDPARNDATQVSTLSLFNPFSDAGVTFSYTVTAQFSDGSSLTLGSGSLIANGRTDLQLDQIAALRSKIAADPAFRTYAIVASGAAVNGSTTTSAAPFATLVHRDTLTGATFAAEGVLLGAKFWASDPIFTPGGGA